MANRSDIVLNVDGGPPRADFVSTRLTSLDAYRGFIMLAMASSGLGIPKVTQKLGGAWQHVAGQLEHVPWAGCAAWDLIQPAFMFMVGVAVPYSYAKRQERGDSWLACMWHALGRALTLVLLAVFLSSVNSKQTNFQFTNVLAQIGLGYVFVVLLRGRGLILQALAALAILGGYWYLFYQYPVPRIGPDFDITRYDLPRDWPLLTGIQAHWNPNMNFATYADQWLLNLFPRVQEYIFTPKAAGYQTLNFVPAIATMLFGLMAGELLRSSRSGKAKFFAMLVAGAVLLAAGLALSYTVCPIVKRIWTPAWALFSGALVMWMLAAFYAVIDLGGWRRWAFPLVVVGMNSIAIYLMAQLMRSWTWSMLKIHCGWVLARDWAQTALQWVFGPAGFPADYMPIVQSASVLAVFWLICWWLYRQRLFVRI